MKIQIGLALTILLFLGGVSFVRRHPEVVPNLLGKGIQSRQNQLLIAIRDNDLEAVDRLTRHDPLLAGSFRTPPTSVPLSYHDVSCRGPLSLAIVHGRTQIAKLLVERGADLEREWSLACASLSGDRLVSPLHVAALEGNVDLAKFLIDHGVRVDLAVPGPGGPSPHAQVGGTALHCAAEAGQVKVADLLLDRGAYVNAVDNQGRTPLDLAREHCQAAVARLLTARGARSGLHASEQLVRRSVPARR